MSVNTRVLFIKYKGFIISYHQLENNITDPEVFHFFKQMSTVWLIMMMMMIIIIIIIDILI